MRHICLSRHRIYREQVPAVPHHTVVWQLALTAFVDLSFEQTRIKLCPYASLHAPWCDNWDRQDLLHARADVFPSVHCVDVGTCTQSVFVRELCALVSASTGGG